MIFLTTRQRIHKALPTDELIGQKELRMKTRVLLRIPFSDIFTPLQYANKIKMFLSRIIIIMKIKSYAKKHPNKKNE